MPAKRRALGLIMVAIGRVDLRVQLSSEHQAAIIKDTRLAGEIACSYGVNAAAILRIQRKRFRKLRRRDV